MPIQIDENLFNESILFFSDEYINCKKIIFEISSVKVKIDDKDYIINGNWKFEQILEDKIINRDKIVYTSIENEHIRNSIAELTETSLKINLSIYSTVDENVISKRESIILKDELNKEYDYNRLDLVKKSNGQEEYEELWLEYNISRYYENIDNLELIIQIDNKNELHLFFCK